MNSIKRFLIATRFETVPMSAAVVILAGAISHSMGAFNVVIFFSALLTGTFLHLGTNITNDYFDFKNGIDCDRETPFRRVPHLAKWQYKLILSSPFILAIPSALPMIWASPTLILSLTIAAILSGFFYTGGRAPYGYYGFGDIGVILGFGLIPTPVVVYLMTGKVVPISIMLGLSISLLTLSVLIVNNVRDLKIDRGKKLTIPLIFGKHFALCEYLTTMFVPYISFLTLYIMGYHSILPMLFFIPLAINTSYKFFRSKTREDYNVAINRTILHSVVLSFSISLLLII